MSDPGRFESDSDDRRGSVRLRAPFRINVEYEALRAFITERVANISRDGLFILSDRPEPPGTELSFEMRFHREGPVVEGRGTVLWTRDASQGLARPQGMAVRIVSFEPSSEALWLRIFDAHGEDPGDLDLEKVARELADLAAGEVDTAAMPVGPVSLDDELTVPLEDTMVLASADELGGDPGPGDTQPVPVPLPEPKRGGLKGLLVVGALGASAALLAYLVRGELGSGPEAQIPVQTPIEVAAAPPAIDRPSPGRGLADRPVPPPRPPEVVAGSDPAAQAPETTDQTTPDAAPFSRIELIDWTEENGDLVVILAADGPVPTERVDHSRYDEAEVREVIHLFGLAEGYPEGELPVGGDLVRQIRTGFHEGLPEGGELRIVFDLVDPLVRIKSIHTGANELEIRLGFEEPSTEPEL